ncbi:MAG TPA: hypothetical protein VII42_04790 [Caulobacteraceae bacterium]|jgi:hypothetical protein
MARRNSSWLSLSMSAMQLGIEAQSVIALRMMKVAAGGKAAEIEMQRMISEKTEAALDAQLQIGKSAMSGRLDLAPARTVALYRRRVRANQRRLSAGG